MRSALLAAVLSVVAGSASAAVNAPVASKTPEFLAFANGCVYVPAETEQGDVWSLATYLPVASSGTTECPELIRSRSQGKQLETPFLVGVYR